uniref:Movement protein n=1 Tax=Suakwa aphid-borne yellows virus TaxID=646010 RepID=W8E0B0_9VIRU|nr:movement protein [Suakwa aphid-borne yellows virus]
MAWGDQGGTLADELQRTTAWLWSKPLAHHSADDDDDETCDALLEEAELEDARAKHLYLAKTVSRAVPPEQSLSGRLFQRAQHSALEYSRPTMSIKSQWSSWSSSPRPLPPPPVPSLMSWTPIASSLPSNPRLINLESPRMVLEYGGQSSSTGHNGMTPRKTSSASSTKGTGAGRPQALLESPSSVMSKTRNR